MQSEIGYSWARDDFAMELDGSGNRLREYTYYPGAERPHRENGAIYYYTSDLPGNMTGLFRANGSSTTLANEYSYNPWGEAEVKQEGTLNPLRYMSREIDGGTGLYYVRNRWYDVQLGRFLSEDPIGVVGGINWYAYAANSPTNLRDPYGLEPCDPNEWCSGTVHLAMVTVSVCMSGWTRGGDGVCRSGRGGGPSAGGPAGPGGPGGPSGLSGPSEPEPSCFDQNRFSSLFAGTRWHGAIEFAEVGAEITFAGDVIATVAKGGGAFGTPTPLSSSASWAIRNSGKAVGSMLRGVGFPNAGRVVTGAARTAGKRVGPPSMLIGAFTASYNATIYAQCKLGVLE